MMLPRTVRAPRKPAGLGVPADLSATPGRLSPDAVVVGVGGGRGSASSLSAVDQLSVDQESMSCRGHAVDIVDLLDKTWFGSLRLSFAFSATSGSGVSSQQSSPRVVGRTKWLADEGRQHSSRLWQYQRQLSGGGKLEKSSHSSAGSDLSRRSGKIPIAPGTAAGAAAGAGGGPVALPQPTPAVAMPRSARAPEAEAVQNLPGIASWAGRYRLFGGRRGSPDGRGGAAGQPPQAPRSLADAAELQEQQRSQEQRDQQQQQQQQQPWGEGAQPVTPEGRVVEASTSVNSEDAREAAWRWRFSRKWEAEQLRCADGGAASYASNDDLAALEYTRACGVGANMQFLNAGGRGARTPSGLGGPDRTVSGNLALLDADASLHSLGGFSEDWMSPGGSQHGPSQYGPAVGVGIGAGGPLRRTGSGSAAAPLAARGGGGGGLPDATAGLLRLASKSRALLQQQEAIEEAAAALWEASASAGAGWAGRDLPPVQIDQWGCFRYDVLRVSDGLGTHQKFLVRGRNGDSTTKAVEEVHKQVAAVRRKQQLPPVSVEVVARGTMEWREDTGRDLIISSAPGSSPSFGSGSGTRSGSPVRSGKPMPDLCGLTASLVRQALPCHFHVTVAGGGGAAAVSSLAANRI
eukprot:scaffold1.g5514.t1